MNEYREGPRGRPDVDILCRNFVWTEVGWVGSVFVMFLTTCYASRACTRRIGVWKELILDCCRLSFDALNRIVEEKYGNHCFTIVVFFWSF